MSKVLPMAVRASVVCFSLRLVLLVVMVSTPSSAGNVVALFGKNTSVAERKSIQEVARYYGLGLQTVDLTSGAPLRETMRDLKDPRTLAVLVSGDALSRLDHARVFAALHRSRTRSVPLMVFGIESDVPIWETMLWSNGSLVGCKPLPTGFRPKVVEIENVKDVADSLAGGDIPAVSSPSCNLQVDARRGATVLLVSHEENFTAAEMVRARVGPNEVFFVPRTTEFDPYRIGKPQTLPEVFSALAPFLMFVRYAAGEYRWHLDAHYANLTIDDPWLREPYGHLSYQGLLAEMRKHNFHTTIAFIPWNYDRSKPDVATLFRQNPERFSVCIHGNNHTHREFGEYSRVPLSQQIADIKQALARMQRFQELTGIRYDRFMVFPHGVAPSDTIAALKSYNFLGTANSQDVPWGAPYPADPTFVLRPYTIDFGNFLSLFRYSAEAKAARPAIAIEAFLDNPLLFSSHEHLFEDGIDTFDETADLVNRLHPETRWTSVGDIARHLYLIQRRDRSSFNVLIFSNEITLENPTQRDAAFHIQKVENFSPPIRSLEIQGAPYPYKRSGEILSLRLVVPAGQSRSIQISYQNDLDFAHLDVQHTSPYATVLRGLSDFRDLYLSRFSAGRTMARAYYRYGADSIELDLERRWYLVVACVGVLIATYCYLRRRARKSSEDVRLLTSWRVSRKLRQNLVKPRRNDI